jgi:hypothetical protein
MAPFGAVFRAIAAIAIAFSLAVGAGRAGAQGIRLFELEDVRGFVELGFLTDLEDRSRSSSEDSDFDRIEFSQILDVETSAYVYHPRFLTIHGGARFEAIEDVGRAGDNRILMGGDWRFNFLPQHTNSLAIYGRINQSEFRRPFADTYQVTNQLYGTTFYQNWGWIPFDLSYQYQTAEGGENDDIDDFSHEVIFHGNYEIGEQSSGRIDYDLIFEEVLGEDARSQGLIATNVSYFGDRSEKKLFSNFQFDEHKNAGHIYAVSGSTDFGWKHTDDVSTRYLLDARWNESNTQTVTNLNTYFWVTHRLYESLTSQAEVVGRIEDATFGKRKEVGGRISEQYVKRLGDWGRLSIRSAPRILMTYNRPDQETATVEDPPENVRLILNVPVRLSQLDIIASTIVVENLDGDGCTPGLDYLVDQTPTGGDDRSRVETTLELIAEGCVVSGEFAFVTYTFELVGRSDVLSMGLDTQVDLWLFDHLGMFASYELGDQEVLSGDEDDIRVNTYDRQVAGIELSWPWFTVKGEYEDYDATFGPYRGFSGSLSLFTYGTQSWQGRIGTSYSSRKQLDDDRERVDRFTVSGGARTRLFRRGLLEFDGNYLQERWSGESSVANDIDSLLVRAKFSWWYGKIQVQLESRMAQVLREAEDRREYQIDLRVRRNF